MGPQLETRPPRGRKFHKAKEILNLPTPSRQVMKMKSLIAILLPSSALHLCAPESSGAEAPAAPAPVQTTTIIYAGGPAWVAGLPPEKQNLAGHFGWVQTHFQSGRLLANGPLLDEGKGFYLVRGSIEDAMKLIAQDPGIQGGVIQADAVATWTLFFDNLGAQFSEPRVLYVANYRPGPAWQAGKPMLEQDVSHHLGYVTELFKKGHLLAGGPVHEHQGRYIIAAADDTAARKIIADDPGVSSGLFRVELKPWQALNRQSATGKSMP